MATGSGAFSAKAGFNQSGGGYYVTLSSVVGQLQSYTPGSGSGGATGSGSFAGVTWSNDGLGARAGATSTLFAANKIIKDMGKTVVSAGRTFRKFQAVVPQLQSSGGVTGVGTAGTNMPVYATGYLEIAKDGDASVAPGTALIARYA
jgi:hypothetical protein